MLCCLDNESVIKSSQANLHAGLNPGPNEISLGSELPPQPFMGVLACHFLLKGTISLRNQLLHLNNQEQLLNHQLIHCVNVYIYIKCFK